MLPSALKKFLPYLHHYCIKHIVILSSYNALCCSPFSFNVPMYLTDVCVCVWCLCVCVYIMLIKRQIVSWYHAELCWKIISSVGNDKSTIVYNSVQQCRFTWILSKLASSPNEANLDNSKFWSEVCVASGTTISVTLAPNGKSINKYQWNSTQKNIYCNFVPTGSVAAASDWEQNLQGYTSVVLQESWISEKRQHSFADLHKNCVPMRMLQAELVLWNWTELLC